MRIKAIALAIALMALSGCKGKKAPVTTPEPVEAEPQTQTTTPPDPPQPPPERTDVTEGFKQAEVETGPATDAEIQALNQQGVLATGERQPRSRRRRESRSRCRPLSLQ